MYFILKQIKSCLVASSTNLIIAGVIFVHDLSQRSTKTNLQKWAADVASTGTFSAPLSTGGPFGLLVPYLVIGNKADITAKKGERPSSGNLVDAARQWVEKQGLLPSNDELPLIQSFPGSEGLVAVRKKTILVHYFAVP